MVFLIVVTLGILLFIGLLHIMKIAYKFTVGLLVALLISFISALALLENYAAGHHIDSEGYSLANYVSTWIFPDTRWSVALFKSYFDTSLNITIIVSLLFVAVLIVELKVHGKK